MLDFKDSSNTVIEALLAYRKFEKLQLTDILVRDYVKVQISVQHFLGFSVIEIQMSVTIFSK